MRINKRILISSILSIILLIILIIISLIIFKNFDKMEERRELEIKFNEYYNQKLNTFSIENENIDNVDIIFIGDSLTEGYDVKNYYDEYHVLNRGIGGDTTIRLEKRLKISLYDAHPKCVVLLIGGNNLKTIFDNYERIIVDIRNNLPDTELILLSLTCEGGKFSKNNELIKNNNIKIKEIADSYHLSFIDLYNPLLDPDTLELKASYTIDGAHLNKDGYDVITPLIKEIINGKLN